MDDVFDTRFEGQEVDTGPNLAKLGDDINITAMDQTMRELHIGVGWDLNNFGGEDLDLDVSMFMLDKDGQTRVDEDFIYYNNMEALEGAVRHHGDSRTGAGDGDDEMMSVRFDGVPFDVVQILFAITIYKGEERDQNLGGVRNVYIRIANKDNEVELLRFELDEELQDSTDTGVIVAALNREGPKWHFVPMADFAKKGLPELAERFGLVVGQH